MPATLTSRRFTVDEYYRMVEVGILSADERVELIEGEIVRMASIGSRHAACVMRLDRILQRGVGDGGLVLVQNPVRLSDFSEPEPDVAVLRPRSDDYANAHPGPSDVLLIIEVAETTVLKDREIKAPLYAAAGIPEYWLVDIEEGAVEVHRDSTGGRYGDVGLRGMGDVIRPLAFPKIEVRVEAILP